MDADRPPWLDAHLRRRALLTWFRDRLHLGPRGEAARWFAAAWLCAIVARLALLQADQPSWRLPTIALWIGSAGVFWFGGRLWWSICAVGLAWPLLFARDWLTQSLILLLIALVGAATAERPSGGGRGARPPHATAALGLTVAAYVAAAFHKLNEGFFDPTISCAVDGWMQLVAIFPFLPAPALLTDSLALPVGIVVLELALAVLVVARPLIAITAGALFHLPLTLAMAPAFVFALVPGYAAALDREQRAALRAAAHRHGWAVLVIAALGAFSVVAAGVGVGPADFLRTFALVGAAVIAWVARADLREGKSTTPASEAAESCADETTSRASRWRQAAPALAVAYFVVSAATPYLGTQMQHSGAMLSNLRIDQNCWNHFFMSASDDRGDNYVRIDHAAIGADPLRARGVYSELEQDLRSQLWSPVALRQMRRNWCDERTRPISIRGTLRGEPLNIPDLCAEDVALPRSRGIFGGDALFPDYLRFQKNLSRACRAACVH